MSENSVIYEALDALRFDEAEDLIRQAGDDAGRGLLEELSRRRAGAEARARQLYERIAGLIDERGQTELFEIARDPTTGPLLELLSEGRRKRAEALLDGAERWGVRQREKQVRRMDQARDALDRLDLELARGLMAKVDGRLLSEDQIEKRDRLLLDISARGMELESLAEAERRLLGEKTTPPEDGKPPWWRRWLD